MREAEMNAYQYGGKKDMESNAMMQQMRQAEGMIMEQKREIAMMRSYMANDKTAAQESAIHANQTHREASKQISAYQQQIRGIESSTSIEKFNKEEMVQSLKSQLAHALVKRPEVYSMEDTREQFMTRLKGQDQGSGHILEETAWSAKEYVRHVNMYQQKGEAVDGHWMRT